MSQFVTVTGGSIPGVSGLLPVVTKESLPAPLQTLLVQTLEGKGGDFGFGGFGDRDGFERSNTYSAPIPTVLNIYEVAPTFENFFGFGGATVTASTGSLNGVVIGASRLDFVNTSSAASTILGSYESLTVSGGAGGGLYEGGAGGHNSLIGGTGSVTLIGGGAGDTLSASGASNFLAAGTGNETLLGTSASGANTFDLVGGSRDVVSTAGSGAQTFLLDPFGGSATLTGSTVMGATNTYDLNAAGRHGGRDLITDFRLGTDHLSVTGASITKVRDGQNLGHGLTGAVVTLSNGTTIQLAGVSLATSVVGGSAI